MTPKITVSLPDGTSLDHGKMNLPKHVLQVGVWSRVKGSGIEFEVPGPGSW